MSNSTCCQAGCFVKRCSFAPRRLPRRSRGGRQGGSEAGSSRPSWVELRPRARAIGEAPEPRPTSSSRSREAAEEVASEQEGRSGGEHEPRVARPVARGGGGGMWRGVVRRRGRGSSTVVSGREVKRWESSQFSVLSFELPPAQAGDERGRCCGGGLVWWLGRVAAGCLRFSHGISPLAGVLRCSRVVWVVAGAPVCHGGSVEMTR